MVTAAAATCGPHRFAALDAWRGLAALGIALFHINGAAPFLSGNFHAGLPRAVDFFFVLSGFVIAMSYGDRLAQGYPFGRYMVLRIGRIWPLHVAILSLYVMLELALWGFGNVGLPVPRPAFTDPNRLATLPANLFLIQEWLQNDPPQWLQQSWSISVELALYLGAAMAWRWLGRGAWPLIAGAVIAALLMPADQSLPGSHVLRGIAGFGLGALCWRIWPWIGALRLSFATATALEVTIVASALAMMTAWAPLILNDLAFAVLILVFAREQGSLSQALTKPLPQWLGAVSYALYLVHGFVIARTFEAGMAIQSGTTLNWFVAGAHGEDWLTLPSLPAVGVTAGLLGLCLIAAQCARRFVESPARAASRRLAARL